MVRLGRAWTTFRGRRVGVLSAAAADSRAGDRPDPEVGPLAPGELQGALVGAGGGTTLRLLVVQPEGGRPMEVTAWLNGVRATREERLGG